MGNDREGIMIQKVKNGLISVQKIEEQQENNRQEKRMEDENI